MVIAWIGYCLLTSALLGLAAFAAERALGHYRKPVRGVWLAALAGSILLPIVAYVLPAVVARLSPMPQGAPISVAALSGLLVDGAAAAEPAGFDWGAFLSAAGTLAAWLWGVSVLALGGYLVGSYRGLRREMEGWTPGRVLDAPVMMSNNRGPAVVGIRRGVIVMPAWIADLEEELLRLVFLHEREHQRAGDQRWFAFGLVAAIAMPWNPIVWWQLHRLRLAIEYDCDRRVIEQGVSRREYAEALLAVGSRVSEAPFAAAAFTERKPAVERRLRRMTEPLRRLRGPRAAFAAGLGTLALILACGSPPPTASETEASASYTFAGRAAPAGELERADRPAFRPYDKPPTLENRAEVVDALDRWYPRDLKDHGEGGRVELWLHVDERGEVIDHQVKTSSGDARLDEAARLVAETMRFTPALNRDQPTDVWVSQWITFQGAAPASMPLLREQREGLERLPDDGTADEANPMVVIDGVIQNEGFTLNDAGAEDIDHIEVIKGGAAVSLYGERARDGVIQITTKDAAGTSGEIEPTKTGGSGAPNPDAEVTTLGSIDSGGGQKAIPLHPIWDPQRWREVPESERPAVIVDDVLQYRSPSLTEVGLRIEEIDHMEIIQAPLATSLYGARARNGAIRAVTRAAVLRSGR